VTRGGNGKKFSKSFDDGNQDTLKKSHAVQVSNAKLIIMGKPQGNFVRNQLNLQFNSGQNPQALKNLVDNLFHLGFKHLKS
jgi:hypothetical protein